MTLSRTRLLTAAALILLGAGCGMALESTTPPGIACDGSTCDVRTADGGEGGRDASPGLTWDGGVMDSDGGGGGVPAGLEADLAACFDAFDNDRNGAVDCAQTSCQVASGACCVGRGTAACCALPTSAAPLDFAGCSGDPRACLGAVGGVAFGSSVSAGRLVLTGDGSADTGIWLAPAHDLVTSRLELSARLSLPPCDATCTAFAAIGLTAQDYGASAPSNVRPLVAVVASASRGEVRLLVGDTVVWSGLLPFSGAAGGEATYQLVLAPDGTVTVSENGAIRFTGEMRFTPVRDAHVVVYGRSRNPSGTLPPSEADDVLVSDALCDIPAAWRSRPQVLPMPGATAAPDYRDPDAVLSAGRVYVAVANPADGSILLAEESSAARVDDRVLVVTTAIFNPTAGARYADPALVRGEDGAWFLYATRTESGATSIVRFAGGRADEPAFAPSAATSVVVLGLESFAVSEPAVFFDVATLGWSMWVHASGAGDERIVELRSIDGVTWALAGTSLDLSTRVRARPADGGFDADEVGSPSVVRNGTTWNLYFAGRRGARWAIGLVASDDLEHWTAPVVALAASGSGFDALSVTEPSAIVRDDTVELYYVGSDGARAILGRAVRGATSTRAGAAAGGT